jgi:hypothetical protein
MRTSKYIFFLVLIAAVLAGVTSCKKDSAPPVIPAGNKTALQSAIDSLTTVYNNSVGGSKPGNYAVGAREALDTAILLAEAVINSKTFTQREVDNALYNLLKAGEQFSTQLLQEVSVANLVAFWKFNGNTVDSSGHGHDGILKSGFLGSSAATATDAGVLPQLTTDRFGRAGMAYAFDQAALVQVPYSTALNPPSFTISMWVKMTANSNGSYMISLDRWNGFKFNLNGTGVPFLTVSVATTIYDRDAGAVTVANAVWTHLAASYTDGTMKFYLNGNLVKTWTNTPGAALTLGTPVDLSIGNEMPKEFYNLTNSASSNYYYGPSFFVGSMDDIRLYNKTLTDAEVLSIFTIENTL